ncbi:hypothetical protein K435DRAFT_674297 [Dendrothele bispora CBS 962.96]|uniref:S-adenosyl-L-methionine-dependent methyltransferase n=1 Tax=Dendrothele bispora (strain CBS 962.96) TaxID=1314807 RepID=A0A4S8LQA9_DENBC|nr:hypothetical protein K435DRAFT_674297 [Dendrothele bispora CBS 962.96]
MSTSTAADTNPSPLSHHPRALAVLSRLHALSLQQERAKGARGKHFPIGESSPGSTANSNVQIDFSDAGDFVEELVALDEDKARAMYMMLRAMGATRVVEAGTSFGVSLIYLLCAVADNAKKSVGEFENDSSASGHNNLHPPLVVGTELEPTKAAKALSHVREAFDGDIPELLNLLQGNLLETIPALSLPDKSIDALLLDIWAPLALPVLKIMLPKLRRGAVVFLDNSVSAAERYKDVLGFLKSVKEDNGSSRFKCISLPYDGGFEMCVYEGRE